MIPRLLPQQDLTTMLCRRAYGEDIDKLATAYLLKRDQVLGLLKTNGPTSRQMLRFLTIVPKTIRADGAWRKCHQCEGSVWTHSNREIHICDWCRTAWRGAG